MSRRVWLRSFSAVASAALLTSVASMPAASGSAVAAPGLATAPLTGLAAGANPDGTTTVVLPVTGDSWVNSLGPTSGQSTSPELQVGSTNLGLSKSRSFLDFDYSALAAIPQGAVVTSAELRLSNFATGACAGTAVRASRITGTWTIDGLKWSKQPAVTATGSATSTASYGASACPDEGMVTFDATAIASAWVQGSARLGIQLRADKESAASSYRKFRSQEAADPATAPTLTVTYDSYPATPTALTVTPGVNSYASSLTPTFTAAVTDPDGGSLRGFFEVRKGTTPTSPVVWSGASDPVPSGGTASVTMPAGVLVDGTVYSVAAYGHDGVLKSKTPAAKAFKTDVTPPAAAVVTSDVFTDGQWLNPMPASASFTLDGSADTGGFEVTVDGTVLPLVAADASGDDTFTWQPVPGWHTLGVVPLDKAGNRGAATTFSFGTGTPAFAAPTEWQGSTGDFPVYMSAPPNAVRAALLWHVAGETTWHVAGQVSRSDSAWDGSVTNDSGHSTPGALVWHAALEPLGSGTLSAPALVQIRGCFQYPSGAIACTANRLVQLVEG